MPFNLLLVITHDTGRELGCYGRGVETPHLDRLAAEGVLFAQAFCTAPQCSPSRASLLTGRVPHAHGLIGLTHRGFRLHPEVPTLPGLLADAGYETHLFGFQHEAPDARDLGYQHIHRARSHSCVEVTPLVSEFLRGGPKEPFLAMVGFSETHRRFPTYEGPLDEVRVPYFLPDAPEIRRDVASLHLAVRRVDEAMGHILRALAQSGLEERTLVLFTTDHGIAFPGAKATLFDPGLEIALIARGPGIWRGGKYLEAMVWNADLLPTLLDWLGLPLPEGVQGVSLLPLVEGRRTQVHEAIFPELTVHAGYDPMRGVRTEGWKYLRSYADRPFFFPPNVDGGPSKEWYREHTDLFTRPRPREMLFKLDTDPLERNNLVGDPSHEEVLHALRRQLDEWLEATGDFMPSGHVPIPPEARLTAPDAWEPDEHVHPARELERW
jgi:arylsulfatase A-like enzyme